MRSNILLLFTIFGILAGFSPAINAEDKRNLPLDVYLIIDGSESMKNLKNDALAWINRQIIDKILIAGDQINVWTAGDKPELIHSGEVSASGVSSETKEKIANFSVTGKKADFSGALRDAAARAAKTPQNRLAYTVLITASAEGMVGSFSGNGLFRWFRSEKYERWQALIFDPNIGPKVQQAARSYMNSQR
jgi:hypothetical protein